MGARAGMLAGAQPCGFALLPAYLILLVTGETRSLKCDEGH
jgi:cytochrome c biogenesis protein CcdA